MAFERRFNAIRFYSKLNHFVLSPRKKAEPFRFKNSSEWFCGLYITCLKKTNYHHSRMLPSDFLSNQAKKGKSQFR